MLEVMLCVNLFEKCKMLETCKFHACGMTCFVAGIFGDYMSVSNFALSIMHRQIIALLISPAGSCDGDLLDTKSQL